MIANPLITESYQQTTSTNIIESVPTIIVVQNYETQFDSSLVASIFIPFILFMLIFVSMALVVMKRRRDQQRAFNVFSF